MRVGAGRPVLGVGLGGPGGQGAARLSGPAAAAAQPWPAESWGCCFQARTEAGKAGRPVTPAPGGQADMAP